MATVYEVHTKTVSIEKSDGKYFVMESEGFDNKIMKPAKYNVLFKSNDWRIARRWLEKHVRES